MKYASKIFVSFCSILLLAIYFCQPVDAKIKTKKYKDGSVYQGELKGGIPWGEGTLTLNDGTIISGFWEKSSYRQSEIDSKAKYKMSSPSRGTIQYSDGRNFRGAISDLCPKNGIMTFANGDTFKGGFDNSKIDEGQYYSISQNLNYEISTSYRPVRVRFSTPKYGKFVGTIVDEFFEGEFDLNGVFLLGKFKVISPENIVFVSVQGEYKDPTTNEIKQGQWENNVFTGTSYTELYTPFANKGKLSQCKEYKDDAIISTWYVVPSTSNLSDKIYYNYEEYGWDRETDYRSFKQTSNIMFKGAEVFHPVKKHTSFIIHYKGDYTLNNNLLLEDGNGEVQISINGLAPMHLMGTWKNGEPITIKGSHRSYPIKYSLTYQDGYIRYSLSSSRSTNTHMFKGGFKENALSIHKLYDKELTFEIDKKGTKASSSKKTSKGTHQKCIYCNGTGKRTGINMGLPILGYDNWGHEIVRCNHCGGRGYTIQ